MLYSKEYNCFLIKPYKLKNVFINIWKIYDN